MNNILVVGAHFDDTDLGVGGSCAKWAMEGKKVYKLTLTDNVTNFKERGIVVDFDSSATSSQRACSILGINELYLKKPVKCNHLEYSTELMQEIEELIYQFDIDTMICHFSDDANQDHVAAYRLCVTAARHCKNILMYLSNGYVAHHAFDPRFFVDISSTIELKKKALSFYSKEHNRFNRLFEINVERNHVWGYSNKCEYAEGFVVVKMLQE